jgi:class 3 adenylate cyclase/pimeloyl-ACP methyl ester carboxylesterase
VDVPVETRYADVDGRSVAYQVSGSGAVDLLHIDGWIRCVELDWDDPGYARLLRADGRFARVIRYDGTGCGMSDPEVGGGRPVLDEWVRDAAGVLNAADIERCAVFGLGLGGPVAIRLAATHPERVTKLLLMNTFARLRVAEDHSFGWTDDAIDAALEAVAAGWGRGVLFDLYGAGHDAAARARFGRYERVAASPGTALRLMNAPADVDVRADLGAIQAPTLVIHRINPILDVAHARTMVAAIPGAALHEQPPDEWSWRGETDEYRGLGLISEFLTGVAYDADSERAFAGILFTDIVGSTTTAVELGDRRWRLLLDAHDAETQRQVRRIGGRVITSTGDGVLAVFPSASQALECAVALRDALAERHVGVRTGVHAAEVEIRGNQVGGIGVHIAARINAIAESGEILVSGTVTDLVVGSGFQFVDRGKHTLTGVPSPWPLWSLTA